MRRYLLAGDIGGTNARLELHESDGDGARLLHEGTFASQGYARFEALLDDFLRLAPDSVLAEGIDAACFSVAGPVDGNAAQLTNLPWGVDGNALGTRYGVPDVLVVNDFAAVGHGIGELGPHDLVTLQRGSPQPGAPRLAVGAGTGLGVCVLTPRKGRHAVHASEGGHVDFAPVNAIQDALLESLRRELEHVSYERLVSGPGLLRIFDFLSEGRGTASVELREAMREQDPSAAISQFALGGRDPLAAEALDLFVEIYGAFCGNMALTTLARGGVYIAGGIGRQIVPKLEDGTFIRAFSAKGRFSDLLASCPVHVVMDGKVGLKGALGLILADTRREI